MIEPSLDDFYVVGNPADTAHREWQDACQRYLQERLDDLNRLTGYEFWAHIEGGRDKLAIIHVRLPGTELSQEITTYPLETALAWADGFKSAIWMHCYERDLLAAGTISE